MGRRRKKWTQVDWQADGAIKNRVSKLIIDLDLDWIKTSRIFSFRSSTSSSRAYARIWGLNKVWQMALGVEPAYVIEVLSQHFDNLPPIEQDKVLLHELAHIPKNFSGSLLAHVRTRGKRNFHGRVDELFQKYLQLKKQKQKSTKKDIVFNGADDVIRQLLRKINF